jgi:hypothetical protein
VNVEWPFVADIEIPHGLSAKRHRTAVLRGIVAHDHKDRVIAPDSQKSGVIADSRFG